uniref:ATP synthase F0 subunit 8 n=1 Tax=Xestospongia muta TaxID=178552 RepID=I6LIM0_XESMU|nr:ATP synthase F0 subunit 8 [Xestospongia muta]ABW83901.1 ATP synthase F0 subunit 8 [Xestospongia muta]
MPQLDTVTYLTQYTWTLVTLFFLFSLLVNIILPKLQQQLAIREISGQFRPEVQSSDLLRTEVLILRSLFQQDSNYI